MSIGLLFDMKKLNSLFSYLLFLREHLAPNAPQEVNINDTIRTKIIKQLDNPHR
jgi:hypothetical protein